MYFPLKKKIHRKLITAAYLITFEEPKKYAPHTRSSWRKLEVDLPVAGLLKRTDSLKNRVSAARSKIYGLKILYYYGFITQLVTN